MKPHPLSEKCCDKSWIRLHICEKCSGFYTPVEGHDCSTPRAKHCKTCNCYSDYIETFPTPEDGKGWCDLCDLQKPIETGRTIAGAWWACEDCFIDLDKKEKIDTSETI